MGKRSEFERRDRDFYPTPAEAVAPTWFLLASDFAFNVYFNRLAARCVKIVAVGRVQWIPDSDSTGKDNCAWFCFDAAHAGPIEFIERR